MAAVTSRGYADTALCETPWSPARITARTRSTGRGGQLPWQADSQAARSSTRPSAPTGLASASRRWRASA